MLSALAINNSEPGGGESLRSKPEGCAPGTARNNYRSLYDLTLQLGSLVLITGPNGSGKSNLYRALRLLAETARGGVVKALATEGGLNSTLWAGPRNVSRAMQSGEPIEPTASREHVRLRLGFATPDFGYAIALGFPIKQKTAFSFDPHIKYEAIWAHPLRPSSILVERRQSSVCSRQSVGFAAAASRCPRAKVDRAARTAHCAGRQAEPSLGGLSLAAAGRCTRSGEWRDGLL